MRCLSSAGASSRAQGTIEYIVLLAIIVVIGLVVVVLASGFVESGPGVTKGKSELYWSSQDVGIVDSVVDSNGDAIFRFKNNGLEDVTITGLSVDGVDANVSASKVFGGGVVSISVGGLPLCVGGSRSYVIKITYRDRHGVQHTVSGGELVVGCTPDVFRDVVPPVVSLVSPSDGSVDEDGFVSFVYSVSDNIGISSCSLVVGGVVDQTDSSAPFGSFDKNFVLLGEGVYSWNVSCVDGGGNSADSNNGPWDVNYDIFEDGSYAYPFLLSDCNELQNMSSDLDANYALASNIDCSGTNGWNGGAGFEPIGTNDDRFTGSLNGRGKTISGLYVNRSSTDYVGLFGYTSGSNIWDVGLVDINIAGGAAVGGLVGASTGAISNSYSTGTITGNYTTGGLVGWQESGAISDSYSTGTVTGAFDYTGGLAGISNGAISNSYSTGTVNGDADVGGLVGRQYSEGTVSSSYSTGIITGIIHVGGVVGHQEGGEISNSYSTGTINSDWEVGGLVGAQFEGGAVSNSYSTGTVTGSNEAGGLVGYQYGGAISDSYSTGTVNGGYWGAGGLVGHQSGGAISNSYSAGTVAGDDYVGGFVGLQDGGTISNCGWWTGAGDINAIGSPDGNVTYNEVDKTVFYSQDHNVYDTVVPYWTFGIDKNWTVRVDNYPILTWQVE